MKKKNIHSHLQLDKNATAKEIEKKYKEQARVFHPDKRDPNKAYNDEEFKELKRAYDDWKEGLDSCDVEIEQDDIKSPYKFDSWNKYNEYLKTNSKEQLQIENPKAPFSAELKEQHSQLLSLYKSKPLDKAKTKDIFSEFTSNLYNDEKNIFSYIKQKTIISQNIGYLKPLNIELSAERAITIFMDFLKGEYYGDNLTRVSKYFEREIYKLKTTKLYYPETALYEGIFTIIDMAEKTLLDSNRLLSSIKKITNYTKETYSTSLSIITPLLESKHYRHLFIYAIHQYWQENSEDLLKANSQSFQDLEETKRSLNKYKSELSSKESEEEKENSLIVIRYLNLLHKLERDLAIVEEKNNANSTLYREMAYNLADWMVALASKAERSITINILLQSGIYFQRASLCKNNAIAEQMADETMALKMYLTAWQLARDTTPNTELYTNTQILKSISMFKYLDEKITNLVPLFQENCIRIADIFPILELPKSNIALFNNNYQSIDFMRKYLSELLKNLENSQVENELQQEFEEISKLVNELNSLKSLKEENEILYKKKLKEIEDYEKDLFYTERDRLSATLEYNLLWEYLNEHNIYIKQRKRALEEEKNFKPKSSNREIDLCNVSKSELLGVQLLEWEQNNPQYIKINKKQDALDKYKAKLSEKYNSAKKTLKHFEVEHKDKTFAEYKLKLQALNEIVKKFEKTLFSRRKDSIKHSRIIILYHIYEASLKGWFEKEYNLGKEQEYRLELMQNLLKEQNWTFNDIDKNLDMPWIMVERDEEGWMQPTNSLPLTEDPSLTKFSSLEGLEIDHETGEIKFLLKEWKANKDPDYSKLFTIFDLNEMLERNIDSMSFSLDPVDPNMPYHPFNEIRFEPKTLYETQFLSTALLADYILKFITMGQEVQGRYPYAVRPIDKMIEHLPEYLKEILYNFNEKKSSDSIHRFWIEAEEVLTAFAEPEKDSNIKKIAFDHVKMVVKKHKMIRDLDGNLIDINEIDEGWSYYIVSYEREIKKLKLNDRSIILVKDIQEVYFYEDSKLSKPCNINDQELFTRLLNEQIDNDKKIIINSENSWLLYKTTRQITKQTKYSHHFSREYIFAQEFTAHYDEFAQYLPVFGQLRELSKISVAVRILNNIRKDNLIKIDLLKDALDYKKIDGEIDSEEKKVLENWRNYLSKEKIGQHVEKEIKHLQKQIGTTNYCSSSPDIEKRFNAWCEKAKEFHINEYGYFSWFNMSSEEWQAIKKEGKDHIVKQFRKERDNYLDQLEEAYSDKFGLSSRYIMKKFLNGKTEVFKRIITKHTCINRQTEFIDMLNKYEKLEANFKEIGLGKEAEYDPYLGNTCLKVPANVRHKHNSVVYGGVRIQPRINVLPANDIRHQQTLKTAFNHPQTASAKVDFISKARMASGGESVSGQNNPMFLKRMQKMVEVLSERAKRNGVDVDAVHNAVKQELNSNRNAKPSEVGEKVRAQFGFGGRPGERFAGKAAADRVREEGNRVKAQREAQAKKEAEERNANRNKDSFVPNGGNGGNANPNTNPTNTGARASSSNVPPPSSGGSNSKFSFADRTNNNNNNYKKPSEGKQEIPNDTNNNSNSNSNPPESFGEWFKQTQEKSYGKKEEKPSSKEKKDIPSSNTKGPSKTEKTKYTAEKRITKEQLPVNGEQISFIPPKTWNPNKPERGDQDGFYDIDGNEWVKGDSRTWSKGKPRVLIEGFEWDVQLSSKGKAKWGHLSRDGKHLNVSLTGKITHK